MDRLVTDNLTNRLKEALKSQMFGKLFSPGINNNESNEQET